MALQKSARRGFRLSRFWRDLRGRRLAALIAHQLGGPGRVAVVAGDESLSTALVAAGFDLVEPASAQAAVLVSVFDHAEPPDLSELEALPAGARVLSLERASTRRLGRGTPRVGLEERISCAFLAAGLVDLIQCRPRSDALVTLGRVLPF
jgi:hypothetical protein